MRRLSTKRVDSKHHRTTGQLGFTLIELLVTMVLLSIVGVIAVNVMIFVQTRQADKLSNLHREEEIRIVMSTIRRDLESGTLAKGQDGHFDVKIGLVTTRHYRLDKGTLYRDDFEMNGDRLYIDSVDIQTSPRPAYGVHLIPLRISYQYKGVTYEERELCVKTI